MSWTREQIEKAGASALLLAILQDGVAYIVGDETEINAISVRGLDAALRGTTRLVATVVLNK